MALFQKKTVTVDSIVADLAEKVAALNTHAETQAAAIAAADAAIATAEAQKVIAANEQAKAQAVSAKIAALLS